jgi:steroid 5-alpha reductase family enzyme
LPVTYGLSLDVAPSMAMLWMGITVWAIGVFFEAIGDYQLAAFRRDPANRGKVLATGLWRLTRHPNYFGDFAVWWGLWLVSAASGAPLWTAVSPAVMSLFLLKVSGVTLLERDIQERRPGYADYVRRTSAFFPWWPRTSIPEETR